MLRFRFSHIPAEEKLCFLSFDHQTDDGVPRANMRAFGQLNPPPVLRSITHGDSNNVGRCGPAACHMHHDTGGWAIRR